MADVKRVLILTADAGFGHRSAANAVAAALKERYGDRCQVEIVNPLDDKRVPAFLRDSQSDYDKIVRESPKLYRLGYEASDAVVPSTLVESALTVMLFEALSDLTRAYRPDVIVIAYPLYQSPLAAVYAFRRHTVPLLTIITDLVTVHRLWFSNAADFCLVPTTKVADLALEAGVAPDKVKITGIPVDPRLGQEKRSRAELRAELGWRLDWPVALAVGSKRVEHLPDTLRALNHSGLHLQLAVVAGGDESLYRELQATEWHLPTYVYNFVTDLPVMMHAADLLIGKAGGLIVTEALACGLPLLLIDVLPGQETGNAAYVVEGGAGELAATPLDALESLYHWLDRDGRLLAERARNASQLGRPQAAFEIADLAWTVAGQRPHKSVLWQDQTQRRLALLLRRSGLWGHKQRRSETPGEQKRRKHPGTEAPG